MAGSKRIGGIRFGVSMDTAGITRGARRARGQIKAFVGASVRMLGVYGGAAGVVAVVAKAGNSYEQLNRSMNRSLSIMGTVSKAMRKDMTSAAIEVSRTTNASAKQAADAYFFLASAGLDAAQSLKSLPTVAKFAQAGNFDLALATDLLTDAQSALGLTVKDATKNMMAMKKVSDVLVKANTLANATVQQFSQSLTNKAGAALKIVNKDIEEGVAVLAAFADQGIKGAEAGTGLNIVMRDLQTKAIKFSGAFKSAGVSVFDAQGKMRNIGDIIGNLENQMRGLSDQAKKTFLLDLGFSDKSVIFVQTLLGTSQKIKDYEAALRSAQGTTADVAGKMLTPLEKSLNQLSAAFTQASQAMGPLVDKAADLVNSFSIMIGGKGGGAGRFGGRFEAEAGDSLVRRRAKAALATQTRQGIRRGNASLSQQIGQQDTSLLSPAQRAAELANRSKFAADRTARSFGSVPALGTPRTGAETQEINRRNAKARLDQFGSASLGQLGTPSVAPGMKAILAMQKFKREQAFIGKKKELTEKGEQLQDQLGGVQGKRQNAPLSFSQKGSAGAFRARAEQKRFNEANKIRRKQLEIQEKIAENTANITTLVAADF